jgi:hypothetical protein
LRQEEEGEGMLSCGRECKLGGTAEVGGFDAVETIGDTAKLRHHSMKEVRRKKVVKFAIFLM